MCYESLALRREREAVEYDEWQTEWEERLEVAKR